MINSPSLSLTGGAIDFPRQSGVMGVVLGERQSGGKKLRPILSSRGSIVKKN